MVIVGELEGRLCTQSREQRAYASRIQARDLRLLYKDLDSMAAVSLSIPTPESPNLVNNKPLPQWDTIS